MPGIKRAPISRSATSAEVEKWRRCNDLAERLLDKVFAIDLLSECLIARAQFAAANGVSIDTSGTSELEQRYLIVKKKAFDLKDAFDRVNIHEFGLRPRNDDFDIIEPDQSMGALFIPLMVGAVILAGCFATIYKLGTEADDVKLNYKKISQASERVFCKDPNSELCKNWNSVKTEQKIIEKESLADTIKSGLGKGLSMGLAVAIGLIALSIMKGVK